MLHLITIISKYSMIITMFFYAILSFAAIRIPQAKQKQRTVVYGIMRFFVAYHFIAGAVVILANRWGQDTLLLMIFEFLFLLIYPSMVRHMYPKADVILLSHMVMFLSLGFLMLYRLSPNKCIRQCLLVTGSALVTCWIPLFIEKLKKAAIPSAVAGVIGLLLLMVVMVFGNTSFGANLSISVGSMSIQPSELVKISYVLLIAMLLRKRDDFSRVVYATIVAAVHVVVLVLSKDLGAALIYFLAYIAMLQVATRKIRYTLLGLLSGGLAGVVAYYLFHHVRERFAAWIDPWSIIDDKGYQVAQSLFAIGNGGFLGTGLYMGMPGKIPVVTKDVIFAAICEELGGIYSICLIFATLACILLMIQIAAKMNTVFYKMTGLGFAVIYGVQVFLTVGGAIKFIPATGVTLPLISYGGSSILSMFIICMIMLGLTIMRRNEDDRIETEQPTAENKPKRGSRVEQKNGEIVVYFDE